MTSCPSCGASAPATAEWCGQCYQRLTAAAPPASVAVSASVPAQGDTPVAPNRWGLAPAPDSQGAPAPIPQQLHRPGAHQPAWSPAAPPATAPVEPPRTGHLGAWGWGSTGATVTGAIVLGAIMQLVMYAVTKRGTIEAEAFVRYAIVATIAFYAVVSVIVLQRLHAGGVRLYWSDGNPVLGIATGLGVGLTLGLLAIGINSAISGHLATDPNATLLVSEGAAGYILATILITMVAAPLVEETLFRGLLAESLRPKGMATAIWVSALAFSAWHLNPSALRYYALMGALFGLLYWKRGLVCSMAAHASFNGVLTVIATFLALTPGHSVTMNGLTFKAPSGWHEASDSVPEGTGFAALQGPSHATLLVMSLPNPGGATTTNTLVRRIVAGDFDNALPSDANFGHSAPEEQHIPAGDIVTMQLTVDGHQGELVWLPSPTRLYVIVLGTGGSSKARHDFNDMLQTFKVS